MTWRALIFTACLLAVCVNGQAGAMPVDEPGTASTLTDNLSPAQAQHYHTLTRELRCLVCQNLSIAESDAPLASDLRRRVAVQIAAGQSDRQVK